MKLIVQIPCYNEARTLRETVAGIPRNIPGISSVEILVVDDGSEDGTARLARELGVEHVVRHINNRGLARAFRSGVEAALALGADIIVTTDGDNQYCGADIPSLVRPILDQTADIVVGDRQTGKIADFSPTKKLLQRIGSLVVRQLSGTGVPDAVSGFRAFTREAAFKLNIVSYFSYTIEMLIQAGKRQLVVTSVPVRTNPKTRESRLSTSVPRFIESSILTMLRTYSRYSGLRIFFFIGTVLGIVGTIPVIRFLYFFLRDDGAGHVQSLLLGSILLLMGVLMFLIGLVADLIAFNRELLQMTLESVRRIELEPRADVSRPNPPGYEPPEG